MTEPPPRAHGRTKSPPRPLLRSPGLFAVRAESSTESNLPVPGLRDEPHRDGRNVLTPTSTLHAQPDRSFRSRGGGGNGGPQYDFTSSAATASFVRRTLCSPSDISSAPAPTPRPLEELLPPLSSSNEVDAQLYGMIAVVVRDFMLAWYSRITGDRQLVDEVVRVIAHCTRALEGRLRTVDVEAFLLDEMMGLIEGHIKAYRIAHEHSRRTPLVASAREVYHLLNPHPALAPVPVAAGAVESPASEAELRENEAAWRQLLVQGVLAVLLPTEDLENACLRTMVTEVFAEVILGGVITDRLCQPCMIWEGIAKVAESLRARTGSGGGSEEETEAYQHYHQQYRKGDVRQQRQEQGEQLQRRPEEGEQGQRRPSARLEQFGLLSPSSLETTTTATTITNNASTTKTASVEPSAKSASEVRDGRASHQREGRSITRLFWLVAQQLFTVGVWLRAAMVALATSPSLPSRSTVVGPKTPIWSIEARRREKTSQMGPGDLERAPAPARSRICDGSKSSSSTSKKRPIVSMRVWSCCAALLQLDERMPWLTGMVSLVQWTVLYGPGRVGDTDGVLDRLLYDRVTSPTSTNSTTDPSLLPRALRALRAAVFPGNALGPPRPPPPEEGTAAANEEHRALRRRAAEALLRVVPSVLRRRLFARPVSGKGHGSEDEEESEGGRRGEEARDGARGEYEYAAAAAAPRAQGGGGGKAETSHHHHHHHHHREEGSRGRPGGEWEAQVRDVENGLLDVFADAYCNRHLAVAFVELLLVRLLPELAERGPAALMEERLGTGAGGGVQSDGRGSKK